MKKIILICTLIVTLGLIGGCTKINSNDLETPIGESKPRISNEINDNQTNENDINDNQTKRESNKKIEVKVEGDVELRDAELIYSDDKKYSLYVLNNYTFSPEEPNKDVILSNFDGDFFVRIEKLDSTANIEKLKEDFSNAYKTMGNVISREPATVFADKFKDSKLWLHVDIPQSETIMTQTTINYLVKDFEGELYSFTFHMPLKEASEGITPSLWAMVSTMEIE